MANIMTGVAIARGLTDLLNDICRTEGGIRRNDPRIWADYMHNMTTEEWADLVAALTALFTDSPGCFYPTDQQVLQQAQQDLNKALMLGKSFVGKPMVSKSGNKTTAWRLIMTMREVVNRYTGVHVPNRPGDVEDLQDLAKPPSPSFKEIFTTD